MAESVISSQTSYPDRPDTSLQAYNNAMGHSRGLGQSAVARWFNSHFGNDPSYNQWRDEQLDKYNSDLAAYNSYITSLAGQKAQAVEAGYNPAWLGSDPGGGTSPLQYQNSEDPSDNVAGDLMQGVNMFMSLASGVQNINKMRLQNQLLGQEINNAALDNIIKGQEARYAPRYYGFRASRLGYLSDFARFINEGEINSRFSGSPADGGPILFGSGELTNEYDIGREVRGGFKYQSQYNELELLKAQKQWTKFKSQVASWDVSEKQYYVQSIQPLLKDLYEGKKDVQTVQKELMEEQKKNVGNASDNRTANTVIRAVLGGLSVIAKFIPGGQFIPFDALEEWIDPSTGEVTAAKHTTRN